MKVREKFEDTNKNTCHIPQDLLQKNPKSTCVPPHVIDEVKNMNTDITGGIYGAINDDSTLDEKINNYCHGGPGEAAERMRLVGQGITVGLAAFRGTSDIVEKTANLTMGGTTDFQSMAVEIQKSLTKKLALTKDLVLYHTTCGEIKIDRELLKAIKTFDKEASLHIQSVKDELEFELISLGLESVTFSILLTMIVLFLVFY